MVHTLRTSFLLSIIIVKFVDCNLTIFQEKGKNKSKKRPGETQFFYLRSKQNLALEGRGCGAVGRAVASDTRDQWFKPQQGQ